MILISIYLFITVFLLYFMFDFNFSNYRKIKWHKISANIPADYKTMEYKSKGWDVFYLDNRRNTKIKIATKRAIDVKSLANQDNVKYMFDSPAGLNGVFYIRKLNKRNDVVVAFNIDSTSIYISVSSVTLINAFFVMKRITENLYYNGQKIMLNFGKVPYITFLSDFLAFFIMLLSLVFVVLIFYFSSMKPRSVSNDDIVFDEKYVDFFINERLRKKHSFCYIVLTRKQFIVYQYGKPVITLERGDDIEIKGKRIIIRKGDKLYIISPAHIDIWYDYLKDKDFI